MWTCECSCVTVDWYHLRICTRCGPMHVHMCVLIDCNRAFVQSLPIMHAYVSVPSRKHQHFAQALEAQYQILTQQHLAQALEAQHQTPLRNTTWFNLLEPNTKHLHINSWLKLLRLNVQRLHIKPLKLLWLNIKHYYKSKLGRSSWGSASNVYSQNAQAIEAPHQTLTHQHLAQALEA